MNRCAIYVRVSTTEQARDGYSIGEQRERLKLYCESHDWTVVKDYVDAGYSGASTDRPSLNQMIEDITRGMIDKVVVYKLDRLSRSQKDTLHLIEDIFLANGCDFVSMNENFDTSTPFGRAMIGILAVFAQLEREQIKERMMMGKEARAKDGKFNSGKTPIGYDLIDSDLVVNDYERIQVQRIFKEYASGKSPVAIARDLTESGYSHKYGAWQPETIRHLLTNQTYTGVICYNGTVYQGEHDAIIDDELFQRVQSKVSRKREEHLHLNRRAGKASSYLAGLLVCGCCGAKYSKLSHKETKGCRTYTYAYYKCNSRAKKSAHLVKDPDCKNRIWRMQDLDELIFGEIRKLATDPDRISDISDDIDVDKQSVLRDEICGLNRKLERLIGLYAVEDMPLDIIQKQVSDLEEQKSRLDAEMERLSDEQRKKAFIADAIDAVSSFGDVLDRGNYDEIRTVLCALIDRIVLDGDDITIHWRF